MLCQVLKRFGSRAAVWERVLLKPILVNMRVGAGVLLNCVHSLVVLLGSSGSCRRSHDGLQGLVPAGGLRCGEGLHDAHRGRVQAAGHLHVLQDTSGLISGGGNQVLSQHSLWVLAARRTG